MIRNCFLSAAALFCAYFSQAQVGINNTTPDASSELDVKSTTRGFLAPRMTAAQMNAIASPATGLFVFNTDSSTYCVYTGTAWRKLLNSSFSESDPKVGSTTTGSVPRWNGSKLVNGTVYDNGTDVGVGTTSPDAKLSINAVGSTNVLTLNSTIHYGTWMQFKNSYSTKSYSIMYNHAYLPTGGLAFVPSNNSENNPALFLTESGNVGVGHTSPTEKMDVSGIVKANQFQMSNGAQNNYVLTSDATGKATWTNPTSLAISESDPQVGSNATGYVPRWTGSQLSDGVMYDNGSSAGVGTTTLPSESSLVLGERGGVEGGQLQLNGSGSNTAHFIDNYGGSLRFLTGTNSGSSSTRLTLSSTGDADFTGKVKAASLQVDGAAAFSVKTGQICGTNNPDATATYWFYTAITGNLTLPTPSGVTGRTFVIVNQTTSNLTVGGNNYINMAGYTVNTIPAGSSISIISNGSNWYQFR